MNSKKIMAGVVFLITCLIGFGQSQLIVQSGTEIKLSSANYVVLQNTHLVNNGIINLNSGNGNFKFSGNANTNISGSNKPLFNNIELAKTGTAQLILQRDIDAWGTINFVSGVLHLNNHVIDLGKFGFLTNENESSHVIGPTGGYLQWSDVLNAPSSVNPGNLGAILTTTQNLGNTTIRRGHVSQTNGAGAGSSILRYFDILPTNNSSLNATLRLSYLDVELNGLSEPSLTVWKSTGLTSWSDLGFDTRNTISNYVEKNSLADFSRWTLSTPGNPLPVKFSVFNTNCNGGNVVIKWTTESENSSNEFEIQRSIDGRSWTTIGRIPASGRNIGLTQYSFLDNTPVQNAFYRIAEFDNNGQIAYSIINRVNCSGNEEFKLWPNPVISEAWLSVITAVNTEADLKILDAKGSVIYLTQVLLFPGKNIVDINARSLASGSYVIQLTTATEMKSIKMIKQ